MEKENLLNEEENISVNARGGGGPMRTSILMTLIMKQITLNQHFV